MKVPPTDLLRPEHPRRGEGVALPEGEAGGGRVPPAGQQTLPAEALHEGGGRRRQTHLAHAKVAAGGRRCHSHPIILTPNWDTRSLSLSPQVTLSNLTPSSPPLPPTKFRGLSRSKLWKGGVARKEGNTLVN